MTGLQLAATAKRDHPRMPVVLMTGWLDPALTIEAERLTDLVIRKPLTAGDILRMMKILR